MPGIYAIIAMAVTTSIFLTLMWRRSAPIDVLFLGGLVLVTLTGVITPEQAFRGFANPAVLTIGALLAVTVGLQKCGVLDWIGYKLLATARDEKTCLFRLCLTLIPSSAFILNTPLVAMMAPVVVEWCRKRNISPSRLLIPVSYLTILGGVCTLIGTSTTLVVNAKLSEYQQINMELTAAQENAGDEANGPLKTDDSDDSATKLVWSLSEDHRKNLEPMGLFEIGKAGLPIAVIGGLFLFLVGPKLLPDRQDLIESFGDHRREYLVEMEVQENCRLIGQTVEDAGLRHLPGLFLIEIDRSGETITPVSPTNKIEAKDRLVFTGVVETIVDLEKIPGLVPAADISYELHPKKRQTRHLTEVVLSRSSPLNRTTIREANFRKLYGAAVVAVHRNGVRLPNKIGDIVLQTGDTLLLQTRSEFVSLFKNSRDFYLVGAVEGSEPRLHEKLKLASMILVGMLVWMIVASFIPKTKIAATYPMLASLASPVIAAFSAVLAMIVTRCMRPSDARRSIDFQLIITIASALGLGTALESSGAASWIAGGIVSLVPHNPWILLIVIYVLTMVLTEMITNNAVAALMLPIAINVAVASGSNPRIFIVAISLAASLAFVTPIGYQTNLMVMGPGGYRPKDFIKCGLPLAIVVAITACILLPLIWN